MSWQRDKGRRWEALVRDWFIFHGLETIRYESVSDPRADLDVKGVPAAVECKDWKQLRFDYWVKQAQASSVAKDVPGMWVIIAHRYGVGSPAGAYNMVSSAFLLEAMELMKEKYAKQEGKSGDPQEDAGEVHWG
jgi:hypothetical protein